MKKHLYLMVVSIFFMSCTAKEIPIKFSEEALNDTFTTIDGKSETLKQILKKHEGKIIIIDVWASWCADCIKGMPKIKKLQQEYKDAVYVFLSLDKNQQSWKKGIKKYNVAGAHYYMQSGWDGAFGKFIDLDWIPRYMVVDSQGNIKLYKAVKADDKKIKEVLK